MKKKSLVFLLSLMTLCNVAVADIGKTDKRRYVNWSDYPYVARICHNGVCGTGYFISTIHVLTSSTVTGCCGVDGNAKCEVFSYEAPDGMDATVVSSGKDAIGCSQPSNNENFWTLLEVRFDDNNSRVAYINDKISRGLTGLKSNIDSTRFIGLKRLGFGDLSVLTPDDISAIKKSYSQWLRKVYPTNVFARSDVEKKGADLAYKDTYRKRDINYSIYNERPINEYKTFLDVFQQETGRDFIRDYLSDSARLKLIDNCIAVPNGSNTFHHSCDGWYGDQGSALLTPDNSVFGIADEFNAKIGGDTKNNGFFINKSAADVWADFTQKSVSAKQGDSILNVEYTRADGTQYAKVGGSAPWRNTNPGAVIYINQSNSIGAGSKYMGTRRKWATFPDEETGITEIYNIIYSYRDKNATITQMVHRYAPKKDAKNNPTRYARNLVKYIKDEIRAVGALPDAIAKLTPDTHLMDFPQEYIPVMAQGIKLLEGWKEGDIIEFEN